MSKILFIFLMLPFLSSAQDCGEVLIKKQYDNGDVMWRSPVTEDIFFMKKIKPDGTFTFSVQASQYSATHKEGVTYTGMVLKMGDKIISKADVVIRVTSENTDPPFWKYIGYAELNEEDLKLLESNKLTYFEVGGISERAVLRDDQQERYHQSFKCVYGASYK